MPLSPRVPDLRALELLVTVARTGSLGRAARELGISQPAVSSRVRNTERLLQVPLFVRSPGGVQTTSDGEMVVEWAKILLGHASAFEASLLAVRDDANSRLCVVASLTAAEHLLPRYLVAMRRENPRVNVSLATANSAEVASRVACGREHVGFIEGPSVPDGLRSVTVMTDRLQLVVAPTHPWAERPEPVKPAELAATRLVHREEGSGTRETLLDALKLAGVGCVAPPRVEMSSLPALKSAVIAGLGPAVLSSLTVAEELATGRLVSVPVAGLDLRRRVRAVWPSGRELLGPSRDFVAIVKRQRPGSNVEGLAQVPRAG